ncbi:terpene cyclase/mutase family protein, partial [bacterium]|nr:terpene cyclase/mutase family protein [bacterium]
QVRRAPWWTISFLVHCLVIVVMWRMPAQVQAVVSRKDIVVDVAFRDFDPEPIPPKKREKLPEPDELPDKIEDPDKVSLAPPVDDMRLGEPDAPKIPDAYEPSVDSDFMSMQPPAPTPVFTVINTHVATRKPGVYTNRTGGFGVLEGTGPTMRDDGGGHPSFWWLAKAQERDGRWSSQNWGGAGDHDVGVTGLALLAFLGRGCTHEKGRYSDTVRRGLNWLRANQKPNGSFAWKTFYEQGIAAMAVCEAYSLTRSPKLKRMAQKSIDYIVAEQPEHGGYRYRGGTTKEQGDTSVTGWQIMAIKSAIIGELDVPSEAIERCRTFLTNVRRDYGQSSYLVGEDRGGPTVSAIAMACKQFIGGGQFCPEIDACASYLLKHSEGGKGRDRLVGDLYYTYYSSLAMYQMEGEYWYRWSAAYRKALFDAMVKDKRFDSRGRPLQGSWDPANHAWGARGGRVYATAMAILSLDVHLRFLPVYRHKA